MGQLTGLDAQFLAMETPRQSGHVSMLFTPDREQMPDVWKLIGWLEDSLVELQA